MSEILKIGDVVILNSQRNAMYPVLMTVKRISTYNGVTQAHDPIKPDTTVTLQYFSGEALQKAEVSYDSLTRMKQCDKDWKVDT